MKTPEELEQSKRDAEAFMDANPHLRGPMMHTAETVRKSAEDSKKR